MLSHSTLKHFTSEGQLTWDDPQPQAFINHTQASFHSHSQDRPDTALNRIELEMSSSYIQGLTVQISKHLQKEKKCVHFYLLQNEEKLSVMQGKHLVMILWKLLAIISNRAHNSNWRNVDFIQGTLNLYKPTCLCHNQSLGTSTAFSQSHIIPAVAVRFQSSSNQCRVNEPSPGAPVAHWRHTLRGPNT